MEAEPNQIPKFKKDLFQFNQWSSTYFYNLALKERPPLHPFFLYNDFFFFPTFPEVHNVLPSWLGRGLTLANRHWQDTDKIDIQIDQNQVDLDQINPFLPNFKTILNLGSKCNAKYLIFSWDMLTHKPLTFPSQPEKSTLLPVDLGAAGYQKDYLLCFVCPSENHRHMVSIGHNPHRGTPLVFHIMCCSLASL